MSLVGQRCIFHKGVMIHASLLGHWSVDIWELLECFMYNAVMPSYALYFSRIKENSLEKAETMSNGLVKV